MAMVSVVDFRPKSMCPNTERDDFRGILGRILKESKLMMNIWPVQPALASWAGELDESALPTAAYYDWIRVYAYNQ